MPEVRQGRPAHQALTAETAGSATAVDVLVVGGGINGAGIARDLAGRGHSVLLAEQHDLAAHTSSASTKLIHGGLRYLEHGEFMLVRKALAEREVLLRSAPHIMRPMRFVMPHDPSDPSMRPRWMIRAGLFLYDHLARREWLPGSCAIDLRRHPAGAPLKEAYRHGFEYSDGWADDARLVVLCAIDAHERGATVLTRTTCTGARVQDGRWQVTLRRAGDNGDSDDCPTQTVAARALVNAAGPWAAALLRNQLGRHDAKALRLVKGSHIVVPRLFEHEYAYIFQNADRRVMFAIPYEGRFTLIGTTEVEWHGDASQAAADAGEVAYLCEQASRHFARAIDPATVAWSFSGVRPLLEDEAADASAVTRDYQLEIHDAAAPLLSAWGGKITTFRKLAEEAADTLEARLGAAADAPAASRQRSSRGGGAWTARAALPGGDLDGWITKSGRPDLDIARFAQVLRARHPQVDAAVVTRWSRCYGTLVEHFASKGQALGEQIAPGLYEAELHYLREHEWAHDADDVLLRRTKLGLHFDATQRAAVAAWMRQAARRSPAPNMLVNQFV